VIWKKAKWVGVGGPKLTQLYRSLVQSKRSVNDRTGKKGFYWGAHEEGVNARSAYLQKETKSAKSAVFNFPHGRGGRSCMRNVERGWEKKARRTSWGGTKKDWRERKTEGET